MARTLHLLIKWPHIITPCGRWLFSARGSKALVRDVNSSLISAYQVQYLSKDLRYVTILTQGSNR